MLNPISSSATASYGVMQKSPKASLLSLPVEVREKVENYLPVWERQNFFKALTTVTRDGNSVDSPVLKLHLLQERIAAKYHQSLANSDGGLRAFALNQLQRLWKSGQLDQVVEKQAFFELVRVVDDPEIFSYLREKIQQEPELKEKLLNWVERSKTEEVQPMAANALTLLVKSGVQFNGADLRGVRIPGADLSFGVFDSAQLQGADLRGAKLRTSWLRGANLSGAQMTGVQFGEWALEEENEVYSCAYSPDGQTFAVALYNGKISLYATSNWEKRHSLEGDTSFVYSMVYSPSGAQIASGGEDNTVRLWDTHSGTPGPILEGHTETVSSVVYSPSGNQIASSSFDGTVRLWDAHSGAPGFILKGQGFFNVMYSPSGAQIALTGDRMVQLWDAHSGAPGPILEGHTNRVNSVVYSPSGTQIASGGIDKTVRLWDTYSGAPGFIGHTAGVASVAYQWHSVSIVR